MYTSCGWFFDELSGIETVQVLQYAGRALQLADQLFDGGLESRFLERLEGARSNLPENRDGRRVYEKFVRPGMLDLQKVGAHYAVSSLFEKYEDRTRMFCYDVVREDFHSSSSGEARLAIGKVMLTSAITREAGKYGFGVLHFGEHNVSGGIREYRGEEPYQAVLREIGEVFRRADLPETLRALDRAFGASTYSLKFLFRDLSARSRNAHQKSQVEARPPTAGSTTSMPAHAVLTEVGTLSPGLLPSPRNWRSARSCGRPSRPTSRTWAGSTAFSRRRRSSGSRSTREVSRIRSQKTRSGWPCSSARSPSSFPASSRSMPSSEWDWSCRSR
jgi:hypothetical protein